MVAKFNMSREENIFWARRNIVDYIWKSARLEGLSVTYPETYAIFNGISVANVTVEEIVAVNNLKHAWQFILDNLDRAIEYPHIVRINQIVSSAVWRPDMPIESQIKEQLADISAIESPTDRAITLMLYLMRKQLFGDGNKRTAMLAANQVMVSSGCGIISVPIEKQPDFTKKLVEYYESNEMETIKAFVYDESIDGADLSSMHTQTLPDMSMYNEPDDDELFTYPLPTENY